jgi:LacI family transcriptional regulator, galactose operon repressor
MPKRSAPEIQSNRGAPPTMHDVARVAGVSIATVSHVLSGVRVVGQIRRERVLQAIDSLGYSPNQVAASLRVRRSAVIAIVVPDIISSFFAKIVRQIEELASGSKYQILLADTQEDPVREGERVRALIRRRPDGLIFVPCQDHTETLEDLRKSDIPVVVIDRVEKGTEFDSISVHNTKAANEGCQHLLSLGHRKITLLVSEPRLRNIAQRIRGYHSAMKNAGVSDHEEIVIGGFTPEQAYMAMGEHLAAGNRPTAIFALTDYLALGTLHALSELDLIVPRDISLLAFDDTDWMTAVRPYISSVRQPIDEIASHAWHTLKDRIEGKRTKQTAWELSCTLIKRESTSTVSPG